MESPVVYEHTEGQDVPDDAIDGMADMIEEAEGNGWEGEHVFDASVERPPHPFWEEIKGDKQP